MYIIVYNIHVCIYIPRWRKPSPRLEAKAFTWLPIDIFRPLDVHPFSDPSRKRGRRHHVLMQRAEFQQFRINFDSPEHTPFFDPSENGMDVEGMRPDRPTIPPLHFAFVFQWFRSQNPYRVLLGGRNPSPRRPSLFRPFANDDVDDTMKTSSGSQDKPIDFK